jgi:hypothetical protein
MILGTILATIDFKLEDRKEIKLLLYRTCICALSMRSNLCSSLVEKLIPKLSADFQLSVFAKQFSI